MSNTNETVKRNELTGQITSKSFLLSDLQKVFCKTLTEVFLVDDDKSFCGSKALLHYISKACSTRFVIEQDDAHGGYRILERQNQRLVLVSHCDTADEAYECRDKFTQAYKDDFLRKRVTYGGNAFNTERVFQFNGGVNTENAHLCRLGVVEFTQGSEQGQRYLYLRADSPNSVLQLAAYQALTFRYVAKKYLKFFTTSEGRTTLRDELGWSLYCRALYALGLDQCANDTLD